MARRKASSRIPRITHTRTTAGSAWDRTFLGTVPETNRVAPSSYLDINAVRNQAARLTDLRLEEEIELAINGNDRSLLPYQPTPTINPGRPRTLAAGYDERSQALRIKFRDGEYYTYYNVPPSVWWKFQRAQSPGRFINSTLNSHPYSRGIT
jgi:hypothetical protein